VLPNTISNYLAAGPFPDISDRAEVARARQAVVDRLDRLLSVGGNRTVDSFHRELGHVMWEYCGMERTEEGLTKAIGLIRGLHDEFWQRVKVPGTGEQLNQNLEKAGRVADFFELAELICIDALHRRESAGGHFRAESRTPDGEALRHDGEFGYVAAWEFTGDRPVLHSEDLTFEYVHPSTRSYK
jgi:succinate dehydrogenase / fumarate reductase flavoprotein subunit